MRPVPGAPQLVLGAPPDDVFPVGDEVVDQVLEGQLLGLPIHQRQHDGVEGGPQRRPLVQVVQDHRGLRAARQLDHHPDAPAVRLVTDFSDAHQGFVPHQTGDFFDQGGLVDLVGQLADDDALPVGIAARHVLDFGHRFHDHAPTPGGVHVAHPGQASDPAGRRKVRRGDDLHQLVDVARRVVDDVVDSVADLAQVVRRHVRRHAHGDPGRPVDQQVRHPRRQYLRLLEGIVEVIGEIHGLLVNVRQHFVGDGREASLGVAHGRRRVAVDAAEVALSVNQRRAHGEQLRHAHQRVVNRSVTVGVELAQNLADDARALPVLTPRAYPHVVHGVQDPALHRLQPIPHVRQRPGHDDRHRVR